MPVEVLESPTRRSDAVAGFERDGLLLIPGFYDVPTEIEPIQRAIFEVIQLVAGDHGVAVSEDSFDPATFVRDYAAIIAADRKHGGVIYDAVKQVAPFMRLLGSQKNEDLFRLLRPDSLPGVAANGFGIRIDNPNEDHFRAEWHQEYVGQLRSPSGCVLWSPLVPMTAEMGPVEVCPGSHRLDMLPVTYGSADDGQTGAYALRLADDSVVNNYEVIAPLLMPGDLVVIDFKTLHRSGFNRSDRARWSMQFRMFDFNEKVGRSINWVGSFAAGTAFETIHPELLV